MKFSNAFVMTLLLNQLYMTHGLISRDGAFFKVSDEILKEWIKRESTVTTVDRISNPFLDNPDEEK